MTLPCGAPSTSAPALHLESSWQNSAAAAPPEEWPNTPTRVMSRRPVNLPDASEALSCSNRSRTNAMSAVHALSSLFAQRSEEHTSELQSHSDLVCRLLLEKKKKPTSRGPRGG